MSDLPEFIQALLKPEAYTERPANIDLMQTQMSFVILTGDFVYKIKKPVNLGYLDYTTLQKRHLLCLKEVELNQRLCPEVYLGVVPVTKDTGFISMGGQGKIIEYAVKMRYLPQERMLNVLLDKKQVTSDMIQQVAGKMADFHSKAETSLAINKYSTLDAVKVNIDENDNQTEKYIGNTVTKKQYQRLRNYNMEFLVQNSELFNERIAGGYIRDCHGDLHAAHICFTDGICIYDCIEFNDRFRYCDVASEIAFLAMDLDHYGRADLSRIFVDAYVTCSHDAGLSKLINFYKCYRAYVRGKVESFKLDDPYIGEPGKKRIQSVAAGYFDLANSYTWDRPLLIITVGLVGTGKSTVAEALAKRLGLYVISSDLTRKSIAGLNPEEHRFEDFTNGIYTADFTRRTYDKMFSQAKNILQQGTSVLLDASFIVSDERIRAKELAREAGADFYILECSLPERIIKSRLSQRLKSGSASDGRWEIYLPQKEKFELVQEVPLKHHIIIDTSPPPEDYIGQVLNKIVRSK